MTVGNGVGAVVGAAVGTGVGSCVGWPVGNAVGTAVGAAVGNELGAGVVEKHRHLFQVVIDKAFGVVDAHTVEGDHVLLGLALDLPRPHHAAISVTLASAVEVKDALGTRDADATANVFSRDGHGFSPWFFYNVTGFVDLSSSGDKW